MRFALHNKNSNGLFTKIALLAAMALLALASLAMVSCSSDDDEAEEHDYDIEQIYGYTFEGTIKASSGNNLTPALIIYNSSRCDWNMSTNGMEFNRFYYFAEKEGAANYTLYWYGGAKKDYASLKDKTQADMVVQLGISSTDEVYVLLTGDTLTGVEGMSNTRVPMKKTSASKNTNASSIVVDGGIKDIEINVPESASTAEWFEESSSFSGKFDFMVGENGSMAKDHGKADESGAAAPAVKIAKSADGKAVVSTPSMYYTASMNITSYDVAGVDVKKAGDVYYLVKESYTAQVGTITINGVSLRGKYEDGVLTLRIEFKPGKMPFAITQIFTSSAD